MPDEARLADLPLREIAVVAVWSVDSSEMPEPILRVLVTRRPEGVHLGGSWELPGGRIEPGEDPLETGRREVLEETGLRLATLRPVAVTEHVYPERRVRLHGLLGRLDGSAEVVPSGIAEHRWITAVELADWPLPPANGPITKAILRALEGATG